MKLILVLLCLISTLFVVKGGLSPTEQQIIVSYHNKWRSSPIGPTPSTTIPALKWNATIAAALQSSLDKCDGKFSTMSQYGTNSEWQSWWTPNTYFNLNATLDNIQKGASFYDWNAKGCNSSANYNCQLWTYAVWSKSTSYGCAKTICPDKSEVSCSYYPAGGFKGVLPYTPKTTTPAPTTPAPTTPKPTTPAPTTPKPTTPAPTTPKPTTPAPTTPKPTTPAPTTPKPTTPAPTTPAPTSTLTVDWTSYQTPIRDQGQCGSCWAFASSAALESRYLIKYGTAQKSTLQLSNQNAVNCIASGCNGGWSGNYFNFFKTPGIAYEKDDPYKAVTGTSCITTSSVARFKYTNYGYTEKTKAALLAELKKGPVTIAVYVDSAFQNYKSGIYNSATKYTGINHLVLLVGYDQATDAYKIKNSWGSWWGESGYMRITASNDNLAIFAYNSYYPTF
ncbi:hypothetical protein DDB_G0286015 [Dictyostelium discoideum AX4]|uniref:Gamete and mating-type specific protein A n=1 Tax=Dictyostelium discoideum TaxID=44689 RepID=GMSA_DICDI|nr:hypothetical protein DDB_G0286015 [Dictyostelium discoideum AX4]Q54ME1.1 RecName: Full=Gamete and mating-type specific protein A; Flags: Precursor [Dictyostelium discoideum]EAL64386.1 hypothetical protein DDB_G0286015 [Dictyostelium discoideum AX4]|eukprot:XP_637893.1 hypothetical protein DDB_G0286015 [Dictyostelium discoideum AX4]